MFMNLCPETICIEGLNGIQLVDLAADTGYEGVDLNLNGIDSVETAAQLRSALSTRGLHWGLFWLPCDFLAVSDEEFSNGMRKLEAMLPLVQATGCSRCYNHVWPGSDELPSEANLRFHRRRILNVASLLDLYGVRYGLEFLGPKHLRDKRYPFVHTLEGVLELAESTCPNVGVVIDFFHLYTSGGTPEDVRKIGSGGKIVNVHANDAPLDLEPDEQFDLRREMPLATGVIAGKEIVRELRALDYRGPIICEPFEPSRSRLASLDPQTAAQEAFSCLRALLE